MDCSLILSTCSWQIPVAQQTELTYLTPLLTPGAIGAHAAPPSPPTRTHTQTTVQSSQLLLATYCYVLSGCSTKIDNQMRIEICHLEAKLSGGAKRQGRHLHISSDKQAQRKWKRMNLMTSGCQRPPGVFTLKICQKNSQHNSLWLLQQLTPLSMALAYC